MTAFISTYIMALPASISAFDIIMAAVVVVLLLFGRNIQRAISGMKMFFSEVKNPEKRSKGELSGSRVSVRTSQDEARRASR